MSAPATLDLREAARATDPTAQAEQVLVPRKRPANIRYHEQSATVVLVVPDGAQRTHIDRLTATLSGQPWGRLSPLAQARFAALASFAVCVENPPQWVEEAVQEDDELLFALAGQLEAHASAYFRRDDGASDAGAGAPRVVVAFADA